MRRTAHLLALCSSVASLGYGCTDSKRADPLASAAPVVAARGRVIGGAELSSPSGFELVGRADGLRLLWAAPAPESGWLLEVGLSHDGAPSAQARPLALPARTLGKVTDLTASYLGEQLALAWVEQGPQEARALASVIAGVERPILLDLGPAPRSAVSARGNIALSSEHDGQRAQVMWRALPAPCIEPHSGPCVGFTFRRLRVGAADSVGMPLSVPVPCTSHSVQLGTSAGRLHYGVCTRQGAEPVTTMFTIQYEPPYARAEPLLKGCLPLGTVDVSGRPWLIGDCHGKRRAVPLPLADERVEAEAIDSLQMRCTPERAELRQGRFALSLREPRANLQALLPSRLLPAGARAGWSGSSLVIVYSRGNQLESRVLACRAGTLQ